MQTNTYSGYSANVNFIKFIAAAMVLLSHAFPLASGSSEHEWFAVLSGSQCTMGGVAVYIFFFYSGLLVTKSLDKNRGFKHYFFNRVIRIFPPLILVVAVSVCVLGPLLTTLSLSEYFGSAGTWKYLLNGILIPVHDLPGVFRDHIYTASVNGSLWTLPVEAGCYVLCFFLFVLHLNEKKRITILGILSVVLWAAVFLTADKTGLGAYLSYLFPVFMFFAGVAYYLLRDKIKMDWKLLLAAVLLIVISRFLHMLSIGIYIAFPYILAYVGFHCPQIHKTAGKLGDMSYGIYLCAFPIQQCVVHFFGGEMSVYHNMLISLPLAIIGGGIIAWFDKRVNRKIKHQK